MNLRGCFKRKSLCSMPDIILPIVASEEVRKPGGAFLVYGTRPDGSKYADYSHTSIAVNRDNIDRTHRRLVGAAGHSAMPVLRALATPKSKP